MKKSALIGVFAFVVAGFCCAACCSPPGFYTHSDELVGSELGAGWGSREESMLLFKGEKTALELIAKARKKVRA